MTARQDEESLRKYPRVSNSAGWRAKPTETIYATIDSECHFRSEMASNRQNESELVKFVSNHANHGFNPSLTN